MCAVRVWHDRIGQEFEIGKIGEVVAVKVLERRPALEDGNPKSKCTSTMTRCFGNGKQCYVCLRVSGVCVCVLQRNASVNSERDDWQHQKDAQNESKARNESEHHPAKRATRIENDETAELRHTHEHGHTHTHTKNPWTSSKARI